MQSRLQKNVAKLKDGGLIPSMTKGKSRWRLTYGDGKQEIFMTRIMVKQQIVQGNVVKVEERKLLAFY